MCNHTIPGTCEGTTLYPRNVRRYDIEMRKMLRRMIPPPVGIDWSAPWHVILTRGTHAKPMWYISLHFCYGQRWSQLRVGNLLHTSKRCLHKDGCLDWTPPNNRRCGWDDKVCAFFRWKQLGGWKETSTETWHRFESEFVAFMTGR